MAPPPPPPPPVAAASMVVAVLGVTVFSDALNDFLHNWNTVISHIDSISASLPPLPAADLAHDSHPKPQPVADPESSPVPGPDPSPIREADGGDGSTEQLGRICEGMSSRVLRHFVTTRLGDRSWLLRVLPGALRRAPDPAELVLRAIGRYYIRAQSSHSEAACELLLLSYVSAGCPLRSGQDVGDDELRAEAREAALSWRSLLVRKNGRVAQAGLKDARGLLLLMAAFGVPVEFPVEEIHELLHAAGGPTFAEVLKCSPFFLEKMRGVIAHMLNKGIYQETIATITAFELQDEFPQEALATSIIERVGLSKDHESEEQFRLKGSSENDEEKLDHLRSISEYVEDNKQCSQESSSFTIADKTVLPEECLGQPQQAGTKRKRTTEEDNVECTQGPKFPNAPAASNALPNNNLVG